MRVARVPLVIVAAVLLCLPAVAQRTYTFEEACRLAGNTTGPCAPKSQQKQPTKCMNLIGNAFHADQAEDACVQGELAPVLDAEIFIEMIGIPNIAKINELKLSLWRSTKLNGAKAGFLDGARVIAFDPVWAKAASAEAYLIFGHEAGHHFCGHSIASNQANPREQELEADRFAGAAIKRFEVYHGKPFLAEALKAGERLFAAEGGRSHPPRAARLEAVRQGYNAGSPCGNLAPAIRGYSPNPR